MDEKDSEKKENEELREVGSEECFGCAKGIKSFTREDRMQDRDI